MDLGRQKKLDPLRYIPAVGGFGLTAFCVALALARSGTCAVTVPLAMGATSGAFLGGIGFASMKLRRLLYSQERRLRDVEGRLSEPGG